MDLSIAFGLLAALCWGTSDYVAKLATERIGYLRTATLMQYMGGAFMLLLTFRDLPILWQFPSATYFLLGVSTVNVLASVALLKSFQVGQLSIVSPIASSYPALSTVLGVLLLNELLPQARLYGIVAILIGIILVSMQRRPKNGSDGRPIAAGVGYAFLSFASMGVLYFALKIVVADLGGLLPVLVLRGMSAIILTVALALNRSRAGYVTHSRVSFGLVAFVGVGDSIANILYNLGIIIGTVAVVSTLSGLFSAVTVLLACVFLKERPAKHQAIGFLAILIGVSVIGYF